MTKSTRIYQTKAPAKEANMNKQYKITCEADLYNDELSGSYLVVESGEIADIADIRFGYDGQELTLEKVE